MSLTDAPAASRDVFLNTRLALKLRHCQVSARELSLLRQHCALPSLKAAVGILCSALRNAKWMTLKKEFLSCFSWLLPQAWTVGGSWEDTLGGGSTGLVGGRGGCYFSVELRMESLGRRPSLHHLSLLKMQRESYFLALFFQLPLCIFPLHLYWSALRGDNRDGINGFPCVFVFC